MADLVLRDLLWAALRRHGGKRAVIADSESVTYSQLAEAASRLAGHLDEGGVRQGDPVVLMLRNGVEYVIADLAVALLGAAKVPINLMLSDDEQAFIIADSSARYCLVEAAQEGVVTRARDLGAAPNIIVRGGVGDTWRDALTHDPLPDEPPVSPEATGLIIYTGGTTGRPKGVVHTQASLVSNLLAHIIEMELVADDVLLLTSPLPHSAGFLLQTALTKGASVYVDDGFDVASVVDRIVHDRVSYIFLVPTMIYRLLDEVATRDRLDTASIRTILYGAAPVSVERLQQGLSIFGSVFVQLYAQTEAPNFLTRLRREDHVTDDGGTERLRSCGQAVVMARVVVRHEDGTPCAPGEVGEVTALTPYNMTGYLGRPVETAEALRDGWLHTGDLGYLDEDGYLYLVDRKKDMIITGGLNVYSTEVEQALAALPGVREVAVTGIPHPDWGEAVVAYVVPTGPDVTAESVREGARDRLTSYKRPKEVVVVPSLPTTAAGKIDKKRLRQQWSPW